MKFKLISMYVSNSFIINQTISANEKRQITPPLSFFRLFCAICLFFSFGLYTLSFVSLRLFSLSLSFFVFLCLFSSLFVFFVFFLFPHKDSVLYGIFIHLPPANQK